MTLDEFTNHVLPAILAKHKSEKARKKAISLFIDDNEVTDADGNPVGIDQINLVSAMPKSDEEPDEDDEEKMADEDEDEDEEKRLADAIDKAIQTALKPHMKRAKNLRQPIEEKKIVIPASCYKSNPRSFKDDKHAGGLSAREKAYRFGMWCMAAMGRPKSVDWCEKYGIPLTQVDENTLQTKIQTTFNNPSSGFLVPPDFSDYIIDIRDEYGVFRREARQQVMISDTIPINRRAGGLTAHFVGEGASGTLSDKTWNQVRLTARKIMALTRYTSELNEDAAINVGDDLAQEIAWAFAEKEDDCGFNGTGAATYGGIIGARTRVAAGTNTVTFQTGAKGTDDDWSLFVLNDFNQMSGMLHDQAAANAKWYCSRQFFFQVMERLALAAGGNTNDVIHGGSDTRQFIGYPVVFTQAMPRAQTTAEIVALLADLRLAASFGDRRTMTIGFSDVATVDGESAFENDFIAVRGTERFDINVHDIGSATEPGPCIGLLSAT